MLVKAEGFQSNCFTVICVKSIKKSEMALHGQASIAIINCADSLLFLGGFVLELERAGEGWRTPMVCSPRSPAEQLNKEREREKENAPGA